MRGKLCLLPPWLFRWDWNGRNAKSSFWMPKINMQYLMGEKHSSRKENWTTLGTEAGSQSFMSRLLIKIQLLENKEILYQPSFQNGQILHLLVPYLLTLYKSTMIRITASLWLDLKLSRRQKKPPARRPVFPPSRPPTWVYLAVLFSLRGQHHELVWLHKWGQVPGLSQPVVHTDRSFAGSIWVMTQCLRVHSQFLMFDGSWAGQSHQY